MVVVAGGAGAETEADAGAFGVTVGAEEGMEEVGADVLDVTAEAVGIVEVGPSTGVAVTLRLVTLKRLPVSRKSAKKCQERSAQNEWSVWTYGRCRGS